MSPADRRRALVALAEDLLAEVPDLGTDEPEEGLDPEDVADVLDRLLVRGRLELAEVDR